MENQQQVMAKLLKLMKATGYPIVQHNGQRKYGPPPDWTGSPPPRGSEVFVGKLPREIFEDELVPLFSSVGKIYEMRLMMDFSGSNRGYAFVMYTSQAEASKAVKELNGYEITPGRHLGVVKSVDNCRLFVGSIPKDKTKEEIHEELAKRVSGIVDVILYKNCFDRNQNRGFAFVEFSSHRAAAMARRTLVPGCLKLWGREITVDWAEPEPDVDDDQMKKVKVLYVRNFMIKTTPDIIKSIFETAIGAKVERVKKIYDYAFIHFYQREHAELAMRKLQNADIDGSNIEIRWAKPVDGELYRIQKLCRGNAKFNNTYDHSQTLWLYKQHLAKKEYARSPKEDEGFGSGYESSQCGSPPTEAKHGPAVSVGCESLAPVKLDTICKRHMWAPPVYKYWKSVDAHRMEICYAQVDVPYVMLPFSSIPQRLGPHVSGPCHSEQQAQIEAATKALRAVDILCNDVMQLSAPPMQPMYSIVPPVPTCLPQLSYNYMQPIWRNI